MSKHLKKCGEKWYQAERGYPNDAEKFIDLIRLLSRPKTTGEKREKAEREKDELLIRIYREKGAKGIMEILDPDREYDRGLLNLWQSRTFCGALLKRWGPYEDFSGLGMKQYVIDSLINLLGSYERPTVLEVGCGCGHFMWAIRPYANRVVGMDNSTAMLETTKKLFADRGVHNVGVRHGSCWALPFAKNAFDVVYQIDVCCHVGGTWDSIRDMLRVAKKAILFTGPSFEFNHNKMDRKIEVDGLFWAVNRRMLEYEVLCWEQHKKRKIVSYRYEQRPVTKMYNHKILVIEKEYPGMRMKPTKKTTTQNFIDDVGLLCSGKSLRRLDSVSKKFKYCFVVNNWKKIHSAFRSQLKHKHIIQFVNHETESVMPVGVCQRLCITRAVLCYTKRHCEPEWRIKDPTYAIGWFDDNEIELDFLPDGMYQDCNRIRNTGVMAALYIAEVFRPKTLWIVGLDFYTADYFVKNESKWAGKKKASSRLVKEFVGITKRYPEVQFNVVTECEYLPKSDNLIIRKKKK